MNETLYAKSREALVQYRIERAEEPVKEAELLANESPITSEAQPERQAI